MDPTPLSPPAPMRVGQERDPLTPEPYTISIPTRYLSLTSQKFTLTRLPAASTPHHDQLEKLLDYWDHTFSWRTHEAALNAVAPQWRLAINNNERMRFYHSPPISTASSSSADTEQEKAAILLVGDGWEFTRIIPLLRDRGRGVVVPDLPGMGWSDASTSGVKEVAQTYRVLMRRLGYTRYAVHAAGEVGWAVGRWLCFLSADGNGEGEVVGLHVVSPPALSRPSVSRWRRWLAGLAGKKKKEEKAEANNNEDNEDGCYALTDSPVGLLSWVVKRLGAGGGKGKEYSYPPDEILGAFMYYWTPGPRGYLDLLQRAQTDEDSMRRHCSNIPLAVIGATGKRKGAERVQWVFDWVEEGGRWAVWERPEEVVRGLEGFVQLVERRGSGKK